MSIRPDETNELQMENAALRKRLTAAESRASESDRLRAEGEAEVARLRGENEQMEATVVASFDEHIRLANLAESRRTKLVRLRLARREERETWAERMDGVAHTINVFAAERDAVRRELNGIYEALGDERKEQSGANFVHACTVIKNWRGAIEELTETRKELAAERERRERLCEALRKVLADMTDPSDLSEPAMLRVVEFIESTLAALSEPAPAGDPGPAGTAEGGFRPRDIVTWNHETGYEGFDGSWDIERRADWLEVPAWQIRKGNESKVAFESKLTLVGRPPTGNAPSTADPLDPATPIEEVDKALRAAGADPETIGAEGAAFVEGLKAEREIDANLRALGMDPKALASDGPEIALKKRQSARSICETMNPEQAAEFVPVSEDEIRRLLAEGAAERDYIEGCGPRPAHLPPPPDAQPAREVRRFEDLLATLPRCSGSPAEERRSGFRPKLTPCMRAATWERPDVRDRFACDEHKDRLVAFGPDASEYPDPEELAWAGIVRDLGPAGAEGEKP